MVVASGRTLSRTLSNSTLLFKFVVAKGFARSCAVGEAIINIAEFVSASSPVTVILPLRLCYTGTVLHITIQCFTPKCDDKPLLRAAKYKLPNDGHASDGERELNERATARASPVHRLLRTFSVGSQRPVSTSASGEWSQTQATPPRKSDAQRVECKVYSNPCGDESFSSAISTAKLAEKNANDTATNANDGANEEKFKVLVSAFADDVSNMRLVLKDLSMQSELDGGSHLFEDLQSVAHTSQALVNQLRNQSEIKVEADSFFSGSFFSDSGYHFLLDPFNCDRRRRFGLFGVAGDY